MATVKELAPRHTPGPLRSYRFEDYTAITDPDTGAHLARVYHNFPNAEGNIALFKAASKLLEALKAFRTAAEVAPLETHGFGESMPWGRAIELARAAIAQAEGREL
jgi:hypothetical protein